MNYVVTGEAVVLDRRVASFVPRMVAALIDAVLYSAIVFGLIILFVFVFYVPLDEAGFQWAGLAMSIFMVAVLPGGVEWLSKGRSLGKLIMGTKVVRDDGAAIGFRQVVARTLTGVLELWMTMGGLAILVSMSNANAKRLGDMMAGTYVMHVRAPKLPEPLPGVPEHLSHWAQVADVGRIPHQLALQVTDFLRTSPTMAPGPREQFAIGLTRQLQPYVSPGPPAEATGPEEFLTAVMAVRRARDFEAISARAQRRFQYR